MGGYVNSVTILGHLGADPEVRTFGNGGRVVAFNVATAETWRDRATNERRERTQWHRIAVFSERLGEVAEKHLRKGSRVFVEGQLEHERWTDREGVERSGTQVALRPYTGKLVLLGDRGAAAERGEALGPLGGREAPSDDIPF